MAILCDVQHRRLTFRGVTRLSLVGSWSPPSTYQGSGVRQSYGVRKAFWEPCSVARRAASASISDFRIRDLGWCDAGLHALRHTFLTEAGEYTDQFTLQYVAGHDNIKTTMRYVHPREEAVERLFARLGNLQRPEMRVECKRSVQNPVQSGTPSNADLVKLLNIGRL